VATYSYMRLGGLSGHD